MRSRMIHASVVVLGALSAGAGRHVGAGPIGPAALLTAEFYSPSAILMIDLDANRLRWRGISQRLR